ncbi:hypothetical protein RIF29_21684 [Crotalaria pallida]|uniref:Amino acid transporter transmembrane domain-containing protein n=1 Tax=Crotalaria pallida TaxID=3830 RepID=A0AAN9I7E3_CROPI
MNAVPLLSELKHHDEPALVQDKDQTLHPSTTKTVSFYSTCLNGLNALSGVGILSIPYALATGGWLSLILLFVISMVAFYSGLLIKRCMDKDCNIKTYPDIGDLAFGKIGRLLVQTFMCNDLYLSATGYLILEGDNLDNLFPNTEIEIAGLAIGGKQLFVILIGIVIMPTVWLDDLSLLSYVSAGGVLATAIVICSVFSTATFDGSVGFHAKGNLLNWNGIPTAVLIVCFGLSAASYACMAIIGYLMFGAEVESQITLSLPINRISSQIAIYTTLVNPISKYALVVTPVINALKGLFPQQHKNSRLISILINTTLVISSVIIALTVPLFAYFISLVGAFLGITTAIILPCSCYLKISGTYNKFGIETLAIVTIIFLGVVIVIFGTHTALVEIINHL